MRAVLLVMLLVLSGCTTLTLTSERAPLGVAECVAAGWRKSGITSLEVPVSLTKNDDVYFVGVELGYPFNPIPLGLEHPTYAVWAEVSATDSGSQTKYHRAMQIVHKRIDSVVQDCQENEPR